MAKLELYRIYFGCQIPDSPRLVTKEQLKTVLRKYPEVIKGWTIFEAEGHWLGTDEPTFVVEIALPNPYYALDIANIYRLTYRQDSVMVVLSDNECIFI